MFSSAFDHMDELEVNTDMEANLSVTDACLEVRIPILGDNTYGLTIAEN
jgi:hypothetical protein